LENGMPPSRAKANVNRETEVSSAKLEAKAMMIIVDSIADAPVGIRGVLENGDDWEASLRVKSILNVPNREE
jgi:hypothetical protein